MHFAMNAEWFSGPWSASTMRILVWTTNRHCSHWTIMKNESISLILVFLEVTEDHVNRIFLPDLCFENAQYLIKHHQILDKILRQLWHRIVPDLEQCMHHSGRGTMLAPFRIWHSSSPVQTSTGVCVCVRVLSNDWLHPRLGLRNPRFRLRVWIFQDCWWSLEVRLELLWPMYDPLDLKIQLRKVLRLLVFLARAP